MATKKRSTTANGKKTSLKTPKPRSRKHAAAPVEPTPAPQAAPDPAPAPVAPVAILTTVPEPAFAARIAPPPPPRARPEQRRGIFFDVENTSRSEDIEYVLRHLMIDRVGIETDFMAVGNWRVIGHETARLLAQNGASLVHSAPSTGVRDWSDLRIAVAAGVWLAAARPGDMLDVVSDDQAFDAVGDVAASLGVQYRRLSYRSLRGHRAEEVTEAGAAADGRSGRRSRRGGRGRSRYSGGERRHGEGTSRHHAEPRAQAEPRHHAAPQRQAPPPPPPVVEEVDENAHTAPHDELIEVVRDMMPTSPGGVTLDQLANALRERGFRRTPGSPRLITRLKRIKELEMSRNGLISLIDDGAGHRHAAHHGGRSAPVDIEPSDLGAESAELEAANDAEPGGEEPSGEGVAAEAGQRRRRRRRGGRRRRGRRGAAGNGGGEGDGGGDVVAAAASSPTPEF